MDNAKLVWKDCLESIKVEVSPANFSTWFSQTHILNLKKNNGRAIVIIGCPSHFVKTTIETRYFGLVQDALIKSLEVPCDISFEIKEVEKENKFTEGNTPLFVKNEPQKDEIIKSKIVNSRLRSGFTFNNFAVSSSNQMAWAAADAVSKNPGSAYNPLFIWGGVGVGKSHLMNAIGMEIIGKDEDKKVLFCTGENFTNDIVEGIRKKSTQQFREKYRKLDVLMIDDIQFIAGKDAVQEEFFHTFNALIGTGSQIVLNSDRPPSEISKLEERLRSRFEAGLIVDIGNPDFELRCAIIQIKSKERGIPLPMNLVQIIAGNIESARKIEGFLIKLMSEISHKDIKEIDEDIIKSLLGKGGELEKLNKKTSPQEMLNVVCDYFSIGKRQILGATRVQNITLPRQILMYLLRTQLGTPLVEIGEFIGGRDHTTVMHAVDKITTLTSNNVQIREDIEGIKKRL